MECPSTFGVDFTQVVGLIAGGRKAFIKTVEGDEDSKVFGVEDLKGINLTANDTVVGIAASGRTPYVIGGLEYANELVQKQLWLAVTQMMKLASMQILQLKLITDQKF